MPQISPIPVTLFFFKDFPSEQPPETNPLSPDHPLFGVNDINDLPEPEEVVPSVESVTKHSVHRNIHTGEIFMVNIY